MPISVGSHVIDRYKSNPDHFAQVFEHLIQPAVEKAGYQPQAPSREGTENIPAAIINDLREADLILADLSALNANVFFELGIRSALDKPVCLIWDGLDHLPFDTSHLNTFRYDPQPLWTQAQTQLDELVKHIKATVENSSDGRNALWKYFGSAARLDLASAEVNADDTSLPGKLEDIVDRLERIERVMTRRENHARGTITTSPDLIAATDDAAQVSNEDIEQVVEATLELLAFGPTHGSKIGRRVKEVLGPAKSMLFLGATRNLSAALRTVGVDIITDSSGNFRLSAEDQAVALSRQPDWVRELMSPADPDPA